MRRKRLRMSESTMNRRRLWKSWPRLRNRTTLSLRLLLQQQQLNPKLLMLLKLLQPPMSQWQLRPKKTEQQPNRDDNRYQGDFLCETCDRSWTTPEELEEHVASHVVCGADGCTFTAHPKVVDLHYKMQHATGLFVKIPKTSDSKEIEAWIAERKKRYPTKERVDVLEAEKKEKIARGEVLEDPATQPKLSSTPKDIRTNRNTTHKVGIQAAVKRPVDPRREKRPPRFFMGDVRIEIVDGLPPDYETNKKAAIEAAESAASAAQEEPIEENNISDEEWENESPPADTSKNMCSVLSALSAAYDSNVSDEDGPPVEVKAVVTRDELPLENSSNKEEPASVEQKPETLSEKNPRKRARKRPAKEDAKRPRKPLPPPSSLLQKLLVKEIRKERNQILQCVRYVVENNFFDLPNNMPAKTTVSDDITVN
uniref:C2H2-type domain-containing protein n=2 Tax=Lygus hesperus TaxID=30085 RepID=A0A0K8T3S1_LYGHE